MSPNKPTTFCTGDRVKATCELLLEGKSKEGFLMLVSENGQSLAVAFEDPIAMRTPTGGIIVLPMVPILVGADNTFQDLWGFSWTLEKLEGPPLKSRD